MARKPTMGADWNDVRPHMQARGRFEVWSRFACEVAEDLIVSPFLFGTVRTPKGAELYTLRPHGLLVLHGRGDHVQFLCDEVAPRIAHVPNAFLADLDARRLVSAADTSIERPLEALPAILRSAAMAHGDLDEIALDHFERDAEETVRRLARPDEVAAFLAHPRIAERVSDAARAIEERPIRLWEAMLWRGENYRWELVAGEVPLVGDLHGQLAANRTLLQLVHDAEHAFGDRAEERDGFVVCGPMRLRQREARVELRFRLGPSDRRVAFQPQSAMPGEDALPTLFGALLAGGGSGKTEMMEGYTDSVIEVADPPRVARELAEQIRRVVGVSVIETPPEDDGPAPWPSERSTAWHVHWWDRWVYVLMPVAGIPWDVQAGLHLSDDFMFHRFRARD